MIRSASASAAPSSVTTVAGDCPSPAVALITSVLRRTVTPSRRRACSSSQLCSRCQAVVSRSIPCCTGGSSPMPVTSRSRSTSTPSPPPPSTSRAGLRSSTVTAKPRRDSAIAVESPTRLPPAPMHRIGVPAERSVITEPFHRTPPAKRQPVPDPGPFAAGREGIHPKDGSMPITPLGQGRQLPARGTAAGRPARSGVGRFVPPAWRSVVAADALQGIGLSCPVSGGRVEGVRLLVARDRFPVGALLPEYRTVNAVQVRPLGSAVHFVERHQGTRIWYRDVGPEQQVRPVRRAQVIVEQQSQGAPPVVRCVFCGAEFGGVDADELVGGEPARAVLSEQAGAGELGEQRLYLGPGQSGQASGRATRQFGAPMHRKQPEQATSRGAEQSI